MRTYREALFFMRLTKARFFAVAFSLLGLFVLLLPNSNNINNKNPSQEDTGENGEVIRVANCLEAQGSAKSIYSGHRDVSLLVVVLSAPNAVTRRQAIRQTWQTLLPDDSALRFVVGTSHVYLASALEDEEHYYDDMVLLSDLEESYESLSLKLAFTFSWVWRHWKFRYLLKADDDTFARVDVLAEELRVLPKGHIPLYWGFFDGRQVPKRRGKWKEDDFKLCDRFLPYAKGGGYILSAELVGYIACAASGLQHFRSEDVALGVWLAPYKLERKHDVRFDTEWVSRGCDNRFVVTHKQSEEDMRAKYSELKKHQQLCAVQTRQRGSYEYNWNVPPSQCCQRNSRSDSSVP